MFIEIKFKRNEIVWFLSSDPFIIKCRVIDINLLGFNSDGEPESLVYKIESLKSGSEFNTKQAGLFSNYDDCKDWFDNKGGWKTVDSRSRY